MCLEGDVDTDVCGSMIIELAPIQQDRHSRLTRVRTAYSHDLMRPTVILASSQKAAEFSRIQLPDDGNPRG